MEEVKDVQAEEMTELETSEFEEAFSEAEPGEETGEAEDTEAEGEETEKEETEEEEAGTEEAQGEEEKEETPQDEPPKDEQKIVIDGLEYTQEEIARIVAQPPKQYGVLEQMAKDAGMSVDDYLKDVEERYAAGQVESRTAQLVEQGLDETLAKHIAETEMENARLKAGTELAQKAEAKRKETQSQAEARMETEIAEFNRLYPEIREIPPEVLSEISKTGHSPVVAYQNYLLRKQETELKTLKQAEKNKKTTPGARKGDAGG